MAERTRHFGGKLRVFVDYKKHPEDRIARNMENAHLKAYLRGDKFFIFGLDATRHPMYWPVNEIWR